MVLELAPAASVAYVILYSDFFKSVIPFITIIWIIWIMIVLFSTFFELEVWRGNFLNRGVKLKLYVNTSEYKPFLAHSLASLILLELKTLLVILVSLQAPPSPNEIGFFVLATHAFWLFALSVGYVVSKEVLRRSSSSTAFFLYVLIFSAVTFSVMHIQQSDQTLSRFGLFSRLDTFTLIVLFVSLLLYVLALYACSVEARNIRIDDF